MPFEEQVPISALSDQICELSAHIAAATSRLLVLLVEFDRRTGWAGAGLKSCAHWLNWKCGLDLRSAREWVRVAHALEVLPVISLAFSRGELSYSKVRALTRIATAQTEDDLLVFARHGTAAHLERLVSGYRKCAPIDLQDVNTAYEKRNVEWHYVEDGSLLIKARLSAEEGALVIEAIQKVREEVRATNRVHLDVAGDGSAEPRRDRADALVEIAKRELSGGQTHTASAERYQVMLHVDADALTGGDGICCLEDGSPLASETLLRLMCDGAVVPVVEDADGNVLDIGRRTRTIPPAQRRALTIRDQHCRFPGCASTRFVDGHHIVSWARGGKTSLDNLLLLCPFHHRVVHERGFGIRTEADGQVAFLYPDGRVMQTAPFVVEPGALERRHAELGLGIDGRTITSLWGGESCDYSVAIEYLLRKNVGSEEPPRRAPDGVNA